jgi:hypothetical protein
MGVGLERTPEEAPPSSESWAAPALSLDENTCREIQETLKSVLEEEKKLYDM